MATGITAGGHAGAGGGHDIAIRHIIAYVPRPMFDLVEILVQAELVLPEPRAPLRLEGEWTRRTRGNSASPGRQGSGSSPRVAVEDIIWEGVIVTDAPVAGLAILVEENGAWAWSKSKPAAVRPALRLSFSGWAPGAREVTFAATFHDAWLPAPRLTLATDPPTACSIPASLTIGRVQTIAACAGVRVALLLLPGTALRVGRNQLWRVHDEVVASASEDVRTLLTRDRTGTS